MTSQNGAPALAPRPQVEHFEAYTPGRDMDDVRRLYGLRSVIKLASNENPLGPSPLAAAAFKACAKNLFRYPDGFSTSLRRALARHLGVKFTQVTLGAGSDELIELLAKAFLNPGDEIVVSDHAFIRYRMAGELMGARVTSVPMREMTHDLAAMAAAVSPATKLLFVANPNNPTGTYNTKKELAELLNTLPARCVPVIDEAYFEYARMKQDYPDGLSFFKAGRNLIVLRTFSKIHGLAGLRLGYGVAREPVIETLERVRPPFNISIPAQAAGVAALRDKKQVARSRRLVASEMKKMEKALRGLGLAPVPSAGNFLLIPVSPARGDEMFEALLRRGVIVRAMDDYGFPHHIRVTLGRPAENKRFLDALKETRKSL